jgi:hypothetical protein
MMRTHHRLHRPVNRGGPSVSMSSNVVGPVPSQRSGRPGARPPPALRGAPPEKNPVFVTLQ